MIDAERFKRNLKYATLMHNHNYIDEVFRRSHNLNDLVRSLLLVIRNKYVLFEIATKSCRETS